MNILLMTHLFHPLIGGVEIITANLAEQLLNRGHYAEVVTSRWPNTLPKFDFINGIKVTRIPFYLPALNIIHFSKFLVRASECLIKLLLLSMRVKIDIINLHYISENALYALLLSHLKNIPLISHIHGSDIEDFTLRNKFNKWLVRQTLRKSVRIISNSDALLESAAKTFGKDILHKSITIPNGIDLSEFNELDTDPHNSAPFLLGVGQLKHIKGFDILIETFALVKPHFPDIKLILIGDGPERAKLMNLSRKLNLEESIIFRGTLKHEEIPKYLLDCELLIMPSRKEAFGIVILEAMAAKKAVIARDVGGVSEFVRDRENGILVRNSNPENMADAISRLLDNPQLAAELGMRGRETVESSYTCEILADKYLQVFESAHRNVKTKST